MGAQQALILMDGRNSTEIILEFQQPNWKFSFSYGSPLWYSVGDTITTTFCEIYQKFTKILTWNSKEFHIRENYRNFIRELKKIISIKFLVFFIFYFEETSLWNSFSIWFRYGISLKLQLLNGYACEKNPMHLLKFWQFVGFR